MNYQLHEQIIADGWDSQPSDSKDLIKGFAASMNYNNSVFDLLNRTFTNDVYDTFYQKESKVINKMTNNRKKSRDPHEAMRDICLSFINKDHLANLFKSSNIDVQLYKKNSRTINKVSTHVPDFIMTKSNMFGTKTSRNVKFYFTTNPIKNIFLISTSKLMNYIKHNVVLVVVNTNTKQFTVIHTCKLNVQKLEHTFYYKQCLFQIPVVPHKVPAMKEHNIDEMIKSVFK